MEYYLPSVRNRHNSSFVLSNVLEDRLRKVKVVLRRVAPASSIVRQGIVWRAEISGCDHNGARKAPFWVIHTPNFIARTTPQPIVEQSSAQSSSVCSIPLAVEISIPTSTTYKKFHTNRSISQVGIFIKQMVGIREWPKKEDFFLNFGAYPLFQKHHHLHRKWHERWSTPHHHKHAHRTPLQEDPPRKTQQKPFSCTQTIERFSITS